MIKIKYECDETGQEMEITIALPDEPKGSCEVKVNFEPVLKEGTEDPYGIANKIFDACTGK
jgi:hypothetical protein